MLSEATRATPILRPVLTAFRCQVTEIARQFARPEQAAWFAGVPSGPRLLRVGVCPSVLSVGVAPAVTAEVWAK
eukprot:5056754-Alexandrium_andersonii.AAC.1